jgi:hypothetical protein
VRLKLVQDLTQELASDLELASSWLQVNTLIAACNAIDTQQKAVGISSFPRRESEFGNR